MESVPYGVESVAAMAQKKPSRIVIFILFKILSFFIYLFPIRISLKIGQCIGKLSFFILTRQREIALSNLDIAFGSTKPLKEKKLILRELFENLGKNLVEIVCLRKFNTRNIDEYIECKGEEILKRLIQERRGGIVLSAHMGNWELLAHYFGIKGYSVNVIARRVRMEQFEKFLDRIRKKHRVNILYRDAQAKDVISLLKKKGFVGMMPDQDMDSVSGVFVDFFGVKAYTANGPAILNLLTHAPIMPCFIVRKKFGHKILIQEPIELKDTGDREKDILENTQRYTKVIEDYIRRFPSQWVWFHERWKTQP